LSLSKRPPEPLMRAKSGRRRLLHLARLPLFVIECELKISCESRQKFEAHNSIVDHEIAARSLDEELSFAAPANRYDAATKFGNHGNKDSSERIAVLK
jgi:hypothetical protein